MNFVKQSRRLCGRIVVFLEQSEHGFKGPRCCGCPRSRDDCTDGRQDPCRRSQTGNDGPAAGAKRERTSLPPAPGAAWSVCRRRQAPCCRRQAPCRRRQARHGRSAAAPGACRRRQRGVVGLPPAPGPLPPVPCLASADASVARLRRSPWLTDSKIELRKLRQRCMVLRQDRSRPMTGQRDPSHGRGGRDSDIVFFVKSQRKIRLRRNENHLDLDSKESKVRFPQARWPWAS
ncbi:hypothetical protein Bca101_010025 [Brassica carinata]